MAHDRTDTGRWAWLKSVGSAEQPLHRDWRLKEQHLLDKCWFSKHPRSPQEGDLFVYYAAKWGRLCALMEVVSDEVLDEIDGHPKHGARWRYAMRVRPLILLHLPIAPTLLQAEIDPLRVRRQSHIKLETPEYDHIRGLLLDRAAPDVHERAPV